MEALQFDMAGKSRSESGEAKNEIDDLPISATAATAKAASSSSAPPPQKIRELNEDAVIEILQRLDVEVILTKMQFVCKKWGEVCKQPDLYRSLELKKEGYGSVDEDKRFEQMCYCAVDRSQGQLIDLCLANHGEDNLLAYITDRSRRLRRLKLLDYDIIESVLTEALQKLPQLEELHLIMMTPLHARDIEAIGTSCPLLKSFTYNRDWQLSEDITPPYSPSGIALAIAKTMPNLRHLSLFADPMRNEGLKAILDGCPHLESLDLRHCSGLDLEGDLGKRLCERIKDVKLPSDTISDIEWTVPPSEAFLDGYESESQSSFAGETDVEMVDVKEDDDVMFED